MSSDTIIYEDEIQYCMEESKEIITFTDTFIRSSFYQKLINWRIFGSMSV